MLQALGHFLQREKKFLLVFLAYTGLVFLVTRKIEPAAMVAFVGRTGWLGPLLFIALYVVRGFFYFPTLYFIIVAGIVFPLPQGMIYYLTGIVASATLSHWIGRRMRAHGIFPRLKARIEEEEARTHYNHWVVFLLHVTGVSLDLPNYASGYLRMNFPRFLLTVIAANLITASIYFTLFRPLFS
jgi:uncharacterized membrane protein YdjX (TVP38/TMEM64 family)